MQKKKSKEYIHQQSLNLIQNLQNLGVDFSNSEFAIEIIKTSIEQITYKIEIEQKKCKLVNDLDKHVKCVTCKFSKTHINFDKNEYWHYCTIREDKIYNLFDFMCENHQFKNFKQ